MPCRLLPLLALLPALLAQGGAPTFVPRQHLARLRIEDIPRLLEQLPQSAVGELLAEPEVAEAFATALQNYRQHARRTSALLTATRTRDVDLEPRVLASLPSLDGWAVVRDVELADMQRIELGTVFVATPDARPNRWPTTYATLSCRPRAEGRWTALFERHAQALANGTQWRTAAETKFAGFPAYVFQIAGADDSGELEQHAYLGDTRIWLLHLPGLFAFGAGTPDACGTLVPPPARPPAQIVGEMDLTTYVEMFRNFGRVPPEFTALGFDGLKALRWRGRFVGKHILDEFEAELRDEPKGLVGALLAGKAAPPAQPLPDGALAQLRCGVDVPLLLQSAALAGARLPEPLTKLAATALTGGLALGVAAPPAGGLFPRVYLTLGIADQDALAELLAALFPAEAKRAITYEGVACTTLYAPGLTGLQPAFCQLDGVLHIAESGLSLRALLKARRAGGDALAVDDVPLPEGPGDIVPTFDLRCDQQAMYRTFLKVWLPLFKLIPDSSDRHPLLSATDMPSPAAVLPHLGKSRGVLRREGNVWRLQQQGALGGIETAALAMTWGPFVSGVFHRNDWQDQLAAAVARQQLQAVWPALEAFRTANQRWPNDLTELFVAGKLPADALLLPGDVETEAVPMPAGDARVVHSSFRYFRPPAKVAGNGNQQEMLLIAIRPHPFHRPMLGSDGTVPQVFGIDGTRPIDQFGK